MKTKLFIFILILTGLISCTREQDKTDRYTQLHPVEENIPYTDENVRAISVDKSKNDEVLKRVDAWVQNGTGEQTDSDLLVGENAELRFLSDGNRAVLLDVASSNLYEYSIHDNQSQKITELGRGPGYLFHSTDIAIWDDQLYIPTRDYRISIFDCKATPCEYVRTFNTEFVAESITVRDGQLIGMGLNDGVNTVNPLHVLDLEGNVLHSFGELYETDVFRLKVEYSTGKIRFDPVSNNLYVAFSSFPYVYVFNEQYEFSHIYRVEEFEYYLAELTFDNEGNPGGARFNSLNFHVIRALQVLPNGTVLVRVLKRRINGPGNFVDRFSHYSINDSLKEAYYAGEYDFQLLTLGEEIFLNQEGIIGRLNFE